MSTLIVYASKYGCTAECAALLKNKLSANADLVDLNKNKLKDINNYDNIIIGSSVYVGKINKKMKSFIDDNLETLLKKNTGIFVVCGQADKHEDVLKNNYPEVLLDNATSIECFGGELIPEKMGFLDRNVIKMMSKEIDLDSVKVLNENIDKMADSFNGSGE